MFTSSKQQMLIDARNADRSNPTSRPYYTNRAKQVRAIPEPVRQDIKQPKKR